MVKSFFYYRLGAFLFEAAASKSRTKVCHKVVLIVLSVTEHFCETKADVNFLFVYFVTSDTFINRVKRTQKLGFHLECTITVHKHGKDHVKDESKTAYG